MHKPYSNVSARRSVYTFLLAVAVLSPLAFISLSVARSVIPWLEIISFFAALIGIALSWIALLSLCFSIALVVFGFSTDRDDYRGKRVVADIGTLSPQLEQYKKLNGAYPTTEQGLRVPPKDPWSNYYIYRFPGKRHPNGYDLFSAGPDRIPDTADDDWGK
jgi:general secretion pathway protein G